MKATDPLFARLPILLGLTALLSCTHADKNRWPDPRIEPGTARVSGRVAGYEPKAGEDAPTIGMYFCNPVTAEDRRAEAVLGEDGTFSLEVPIEMNTKGHIFSNRYKTAILVPLEAGKEIKLELTGDSSVKIDYTGDMRLTPYDRIHYADAVNMFYTYGSGQDKLYEMTPEEFARHEIRRLADRSKYAMDSFLFSEPARNLLQDEFRLLYLKGRMLSYKESVELCYDALNAGTKHEPFIPQEPGRSYYRFLREFDLNNPRYLYCTAYRDVLQCILSIDSLRIPPIGDTPIPQWQGQVKASIADLIGFDSGQFYDMLAANAYAAQFNTRVQSLTAAQKQNIEAYFKDGGIGKILLEKNQEVIRREEEMKKSVVNQTPDVPDEQLMEAIVARYRGKAVVVDFWGTWCQPCLQEIALNREIRDGMQGKDIVFVYITEDSSPREKWLEKIKSIGGEQYRLTSGQWDYMLDSFGFNGVPSHLFYDRDGKLKNKETGMIMGVKMQEMIADILPE